MAPTIETSQGTHSPGSASSLANRMASIVSSSSRVAPPSTGRQAEQVNSTGRQAEQVKSSSAPVQVTSSVATAASRQDC